MLPGLRFVFGALTTIALMGMFGVGLFVSARLSHQAKMGPLESSRNLAFTDSAEWNQFYDAGSVRRFIGLARQGEAQEITEVPPEHRSAEAIQAPVAVALAPMEPPPRQDGGAETAPLVRPPADTAGHDGASAAETSATLAPPALPDQAREPPVTERTAVLGKEAVPGNKPGTAETLIAHVAATSVPGEPSSAKESAPAATHLTEAMPDGAGAIMIEAENGWDQEPWDTTPLADGGMSETAAVTERAVTAPASPAEFAPPPQPKAQPPDAPHPAAALAKAAVPVPVPAPAVRGTVRVKRATPDDDEPERSRATSTPRPRAPASRPARAPQAYGPQGSGAPPLPPPGQPVFGPHFPYATPQPSQPQFGQQQPGPVSRQAAPRTRAPQYSAQPSYDPRQFTPQPPVPQTAPRQPSYGPAYGWR